MTDLKTWWIPKLKIPDSHSVIVLAACCGMHERTSLTWFPLRHTGLILIRPRAGATSVFSLQSCSCLCTSHNKYREPHLSVWIQTRLLLLGRSLKPAVKLIKKKAPCLFGLHPNDHLTDLARLRPDELEVKAYTPPRTFICYSRMMLVNNLRKEQRERDDLLVDLNTRSANHPLYIYVHELGCLCLVLLLIL